MDNIYDNLLRLTKALRAADAASQRAVEARSALPAGSSRARVTTANARWARAAEARDRAHEDLAQEIYWLPGLRNDVLRLLPYPEAKVAKVAKGPSEPAASS